MTHRKIKSLLLTLLALALFPAFALEIRVDFEENEVPGSGNWNTVDDATGSDATDLNDWDTGLPTGISLTMTGLSTSGTTGNDDSRSTYPSWSPSEANTDRFFMGSDSSGTMTISGLTAGLTYTVELVSAYASGNSGKEYATYTMNDDSALGYAIPFNGTDGTTRLDYPSDVDHTDADGTAWWTGNLDAGGSGSSDWMTEGWLLWDAVADTNGELTLDYATTSNSLSRVAFNSMRITAIPEPSTLAMLGIAMGVLGASRFRRRR